MRVRRGVGLRGGVEGAVASGRVAPVRADGAGEGRAAGRGGVHDAAECAGGEVGEGRRRA